VRHHAVTEGDAVGLDDRDDLPGRVEDGLEAGSVAEALGAGMDLPLKE
jgi:hypothetical protein